MSRSCRPFSRRISVVAVALALVLTGCGPGDDEPSGGETLASFFGYDEDDSEDWEARWRDQEREVQEHIRRCMAEKGFEYIPVEHASGSFVVYDAEDEEERIRRQGFGITTWFGDDGDVADPIDEPMEDPNWERVEAMSEAEREAYYEALHGSFDDEHYEIEYDEETGEEYHVSYGFGGGCEGEAHEEVYGGGGDREEVDELWEQLEPAYEALYERIQADPRIVEWNEEWVACMAAAGYDYSAPDDMYDAVWQEFDQRLEEILGPDGGYVDPFEGWSEADIAAFFEERTQDEIDAFFREADAQRQSNVDQEALAALQQEEIELAVTDFECRGGQSSWELYDEVSRSYEADFIAENRQLLEQLREAEGR
jgi:hypothetical protein